MRLSTISFAGTARTEVAVGISRLASMFVTTRAEVPLSFSITSSASDAGAGLETAAALSATTGACVAGVATGCADASGVTAGATGAADFLVIACGECSAGE